MVSIIVDTREASKAKKICAKLKKFGASVLYNTLEFGDYYIPSERKNILVERKTVTDFVQTVKGGRLWEQLAGLKSANAEPRLLLEGNLLKLKKHTAWRLESVVALLNSVKIDWGIPVDWSPNTSITALMLLDFAKRVQEKELKKIYPLRFKPKLETDEDRARFIVESLPMVSVSRAVALLNRFGTVQAIVNASLKELAEVEGIGRKIAGEIFRIVRHRWR